MHECWVTPTEFGGYVSAAFGTMSTWEEMHAFELHHVGPGGMANGKRHQATNVMIHPVSENRVHITHDMLVIEVAAEPRIIATGRYNKSVAMKTEKGWRFKSRTLDVDPGFFVLMGNQANG
jgi:hypothetical protein